MLGNIHKQVNSDALFNLSASLKNDLDEIQDSVYQIKEAQQWVSIKNVKLKNISNNNQAIFFLGRIKEYTLDSDVTFYIRKSGEDNYNKLPIDLQKNGEFTVEFEINKEDKPTWIVSYIYENDTKSLQNNSPYIYEYYITLNSPNKLLNSEVENINLKRFIQIYEEPEVKVIMNREDTPSAIELQWDNSGIMPQKAYIEIYKDNTINEEEFEFDDEEEMAKWKSNNKSFEKLTIRVEYENNKSFKKEIWNGRINFPSSKYKDIKFKARIIDNYTFSRYY